MRQTPTGEQIAAEMRVFGQNMRAARNDMGVAQDHQQLKELKLDKKMVSYLERGERSPRLRTILNVAKALRVPPQELFRGISAQEASTELPPPQPGLIKPEARFGANLRWARKREGISQMEFAQEANIHRVAVGAIERGERSPMLHTILKLAWTLELPHAVLLHEVQDAQGRRGANGSS